jgi:excisionase family DNA binding protein
MPRSKQVVPISVAVPTEPLLVSVRDAARLLGVKIYSVRRLVRAGSLSYRVVGNRWLVNFQSLKTFANGKGKAA